MWLLAAASAIVLTPSPRVAITSPCAAVRMMADDDASPQSRAVKQQEREAVAAARRTTAAELTLSGEEVEALTAASKSLDPCWREGAAEDCPTALKSVFTQQPIDFFAALRNPQEDPDPAVWIGVRKTWPVLAERSDDDLLAALQPIKDVRVDKRSL